MEVIVNGFRENLREKISIMELMKKYHEEDAHLIVEHNGRFVYPRQYAATFLSDGDRIEFINPNFGG